MAQKNAFSLHLPHSSFWRQGTVHIVLYLLSLTRGLQGAARAGLYTETHVGVKKRCIWCITRLQAEPQCTVSSRFCLARGILGAAIVSIQGVGVPTQYYVTTLPPCAATWLGPSAGIAAGWTLASKHHVCSPKLSKELGCEILLWTAEVALQLPLFFINLQNRVDCQF